MYLDAFLSGLLYFGSWRILVKKNRNGLADCSGRTGGNLHVRKGA